MTSSLDEPLSLDFAGSTLEGEEDKSSRGPMHGEIVVRIAAVRQRNCGGNVAGALIH
jgi:hypothetical protein